MESKITIGGQALIEGVMMRSQDKYAICVRRPNKSISTKIIKIKKNKINDIPILRGVSRFIESLTIGVNAISYSATESAGEDEKLNAFELVFTLFLSIVLTISLFYIAPLLLARLTGTAGLLFNVLDGIFRLLIFFLYLGAISMLPDVKRVFQYHGAEHKTVFCYENGEKLTLKNIKKYQTMHPRCGTNFIILVFIFSIFFFAFIPVGTLLYKFFMRLLLIPLIAGVSYEILKFAGKHYENPLVKIMIWPGIMLQKITTREPEDHMIKVAIKSLKSAISKN